MTPLMSKEEIDALKRQPRVRSAHTVTLIQVTSVEGAHDQTEDGDVFREVNYYYLLDGTLIARIDPWPEART